MHLDEGFVARWPDWTDAVQATSHKSEHNAKYEFMLSKLMMSNTKFEERPKAQQDKIETLLQKFKP